MEGPPSINDFSPSAGNQAEDTFVGRHPFSSRSFRWDSKRWCEIEFVHPVCSTHRVAGLFWRLRFFKSVARQDRPGNYKGCLQLRRSKGTASPLSRRATRVTAALACQGTSRSSGEMRPRKHLPLVTFRRRGGHDGRHLGKKLGTHWLLDSSKVEGYLARAGCINASEPRSFHYTASHRIATPAKRKRHCKRGLVQNKIPKITPAPRDTTPSDFRKSGGKASGQIGANWEKNSRG